MSFTSQLLLLLLLLLVQDSSANSTTTKARDTTVTVHVLETYSPWAFGTKYQIGSYNAAAAEEGGKFCSLDVDSKTTTKWTLVLSFKALAMSLTAPCAGK